MAICACVYAGLNFGRLGDTAFGVIWLMWAFLWLLFFLVLGLGKEGLSRYTGAVAAIEGWVTGVIPAFLLLSGRWVTYDRTAAIVLVVISVVAFGALYPKLKGPVAGPEGTRGRRRAQPRVTHARATAS